MGDYSQYIWLVVGGLQGLLMWGTQVGPKQVVSHAAEWAAAFGIKNPPAWLRSESADRFIRHTALVILLVSVLGVAAPHIDLEKIQLGPKILFGISFLGMVGAIIWHLVAGTPTITAVDASVRSPHPDLVLRVDVESRTGNSAVSADGTFFLTELGSWIVLKNLTDKPIAYRITDWFYHMNNTSNPQPDMRNMGGIVYAHETSSFKLPAAIMTPPVIFVPGKSKYTYTGKIGFNLLYGPSPGEEKIPMKYEADLKVEIWSEGQKINCLTTGTRIENQPTPSEAIQNITSNNQSGGITAHTVNVGEKRK
jgi:hypothetical protein